MWYAAAITWIPILTLPAGVFLFTPSAWPRWAFMWFLAGSIFFSTKWLTWRAASREGVTGSLQVGYLLAWPGLDAPAFLHAVGLRHSLRSEWLFASVKLVFGVVLILSAGRISPDFELTRGWIGMVGILFILHFGVFHLLSLAWRAGGVCARPIMNWPVLATSVSDFWGRRWNRAFRDLTHRFLFCPLTPRLGAKMALWIGFLLSGLMHDLVISVPAQGGYGGPTVFFLIQAGAIFVERSALGKRVGLGGGLIGWGFAMLVLVGPLVILFHPPFVREVIVPFIDWVHLAVQGLHGSSP